MILMSEVPLYRVLIDLASGGTRIAWVGNVTGVPVLEENDPPLRTAIGPYA